MRNSELKKHSLLAEVACDYYERGYSQEEISERFLLSRTRISRLLKEAREKGIVQITINYSYERVYELEDLLISKYNIQEARVLNKRNIEPEDVQRSVARLAADYVMEKVRKNMVIGTSWGTTLSDMTEYLHELPFPVQVVQLMGAVPCAQPSHTPQGIVSEISKLFNCSGNYLNLPLFIEDPKARKMLCNDINNQRILNLGLFSDMILTSVNSLSSIRDRSFWKEYMTDEMFRELQKKEAVGAIFARFFDANGKEISCKWNRSCVSISLQQIQDVPDVVVIASGKEKAETIHAALNGGLINTLITDGTTAAKVMGMATIE